MAKGTQRQSSGTHPIKATKKKKGWKGMKLKETYGTTLSISKFPL